MHIFSTGCPFMSFTIVLLFYSTLIIEKIRTSDRSAWNLLQ